MNARTVVLRMFILASTAKAFVVPALRRTTTGTTIARSRIARRPPPHQHRHASTLLQAEHAAAAAGSIKKRSPKPNVPFPTVTLKRTQQSRAFREGNQLVFTRAVERTSDAPLRAGDVVHVEILGDVNKNKIQQPNLAIGWGVYNPDSLYKVRILNHKLLQPNLYAQVCKLGSGNEDHEDQAVQLILTHHIKTAVVMRRAVGLPSVHGAVTETDTYRLINGEGDGLSGLAVDVIGSVVVVMSSAAWCEQYRTTIEHVLKEAFSPTGDDTKNIIWKSAPARLKQDGVQVAAEGSSDNGAQAKSDMVVSLENGIQYETYPGDTGQKTGVYSDQRENRSMLATHTKNKTVLDLCCFSGGFSLNAAKHGGAAHCTAVDSSPVAVEMCVANAVRNGVLDKMDVVQSDITKFLQSTDKTFDVVVLDPPKLAPSAKLLDKARRKYHALNRDAVRVVNPLTGGLLLTCTCSAAMTQAEGGQVFLKMVQAAALSAGRQVTLLSSSGAASCHTQSPISYPASAYLTAALFYVHPETTE